MTKIEALAQTAAILGDDQLDGLIAYATHLAQGDLVALSPLDVQASLQRGQDHYANGQTGLATDAFERINTKINAARS